MHILFLNQFFWPDQAPTGRLMQDLCRELVAEGHRVTVICGQNGYAGETREEAPAVEIIRLPNLAFSRGKFSRALSWWSFLMMAGLRTLIVPSIDEVVSMTTPPALSLAVLPGSRVRGARLWIWEMDVYPDVAVALGHLAENSIVCRLMGSLLDWSRRKSHGVIVLGDCMKRRLVARGIPAEKILVHENWAEFDQPAPLHIKPGDPITILYCGNFGLAHDIETLQGVLLAVREESYRFVFAGGGAQRRNLEDFCRNHHLHRASFLPYLDGQELYDQLASCHLGLVTLRPECAGTMVPCKFYSPLAAGRPVLFIGPENCTPAAHIREQQCGWARQPGDVDGVVELLRSLTKNPRKLALAGAKAVEAQRGLFNGKRRITTLAAQLTGDRVDSLPQKVSRQWLSPF